MFLQFDLDSPFHIPEQSCCFRAGLCRQPRVLACLLGSNGTGLNPLLRRPWRLLSGGFFCYLVRVGFLFSLSGSRRRISLSCEHLRALLPQFDGRREDMASVLEMSVYFLQLAHSMDPSWEQLSVSRKQAGLVRCLLGDILV